MPTIHYTDHLKLRLLIRKIPESYPRLIYEEAERTFYDTAEDKWIAIKKLAYNQKTRPMMIAYEQRGEIVEIVTIHPITEEKIINRILRSRWSEHG